MPSDFGYGAPKENQWLSGQCQYQVNKAALIAQIGYYKNLGVKSTTYVNPIACGQAGYEILRRHPEWATYGENGQYIVDNIYSLYPDPFQIASPIEIDKKIVDENTIKIDSWQGTVINLHPLIVILKLLNYNLEITLSLSAIILLITHHPSSIFW